MLGFPEGVKGPLEIWVTYLRRHLSAQLCNFCNVQLRKPRYNGAALPSESVEREWRRRGGCLQEAIRVGPWTPSLGKKMRRTFGKWWSLDNWSQCDRNIWNWSIFSKQARGQHHSENGMLKFRISETIFPQPCRIVNNLQNEIPELRKACCPHLTQKVSPCLKLCN